MLKAKEFKEINHNLRIDYQIDHMQEEANDYNHIRIRKFRHCSADIIETNNYICLRSYATIVAFINKEERILYDVLRYVYGYTATSCHHIAKFRSDYFDKYDIMLRVK